MRWVVLPAAALVAACGAAGSGGPSSGSTSALVTGDTCTLHQDAVSCRADSQGCSWYPNTRACAVDQPCPPGWCYHPQPGDGGAAGDGGVAAVDGGVAVAGCACPGAAGDACVMQIGGLVTQVAVEPTITCEAIPAGCSAPDPCSCLAQGLIETCRSSGQVTNLCVCDNGIR